MIDHLTAFFQDRDDITTAIIYGSLAEGRARPDSDADIAAAGKDLLSYDRLLELSAALEKVTGRETQVRDLRRLQGTILSQVLTKGRLLKNADPGFLEKLYIQHLDFTEDISLPFQALRLKRLEEFFNGQTTGSD